MGRRKGLTQDEARCFIDGNHYALDVQSLIDQTGLVIEHGEQRLSALSPLLVPAILCAMDSCSNPSNSASWAAKYVTRPPSPLPQSESPLEPQSEEGRRASWSFEGLVAIIRNAVFSDTDPPVPLYQENIGKRTGGFIKISSDFQSRLIAHLELNHSREYTAVQAWMLARFTRACISAKVQSCLSNPLSLLVIAIAPAKVHCKSLVSALAFRL